MATVLFCGECWSWASGNDPPAVLFKPKRLSPHGSAPSSELAGQELLRGLRKPWKDLATTGRQTSGMSVVSLASARWADHPSYLCGDVLVLGQSGESCPKLAETPSPLQLAGSWHWTQCSSGASVAGAVLSYNPAPQTSQGLSVTTRPGSTCARTGGTLERGIWERPQPSRIGTGQLGRQG